MPEARVRQGSWQYFRTGTEREHALAPIADLVREIAAAAADMAQIISLGRLGEDGHADAGNLNPDGDVQKKLDIFANSLFLDALRRAPVAAALSEELAEPLQLDPNAPLAVAIDPLDGSSNIDPDIKREGPSSPGTRFQESDKEGRKCRADSGRRRSLPERVKGIHGRYTLHIHRVQRRRRTLRHICRLRCIRLPKLNRHFRQRNSGSSSFGATGNCHRLGRASGKRHPQQNRPDRGSWRCREPAPCPRNAPVRCRVAKEDGYSGTDTTWRTGLTKRPLSKLGGCIRVTRRQGVWAGTCGDQ